MAASFRPDDGSADDGVVAEINITPLTDVFLVLLIIFMVTSSVVANQSKNIDLPGALGQVTALGCVVWVNSRDDDPGPRRMALRFERFRDVADRKRLVAYLGGGIDQVAA